MANKPDVARQDPAEGSREIVERELKRQGDGQGRAESGEPASAGEARNASGRTKPGIDPTFVWPARENVAPRGLG
jgi:hypothetical protein